jgi:hypothetical protein
MRIAKPKLHGITWANSTNIILSKISHTKEYTGSFRLYDTQERQKPLMVLAARISPTLLEGARRIS